MIQCGQGANLSPIFFENELVWKIGHTGRLSFASLFFQSVNAPHIVSTAGHSHHSLSGLQLFKQCKAVWLL